MNLAKLPRIYVPEPLEVQRPTWLDEVAAKHLLQVLRLTKGDQLLVFDGLMAGEFLATIVTLEQRKVKVLPLEFVPVNRELPLRIHLGQGIARGEKMDFILQKAVELGVTAITPLFTDYCNVKLNAERLQQRTLHWQGVVRHAAEQSGRCYMPQVHTAQGFSRYFALLKKSVIITLDPTATVAFKEVLAQNVAESTTELVLVVGPEGGFSDQELGWAQQCGSLFANLGARVLRTETAALAALAYLALSDIIAIKNNN